MSNFILECSLADGGTFTTMSSEVGAIACVLSKVPYAINGVTVHEWEECVPINGRPQKVWKKKGEYPWRI